MKWNKHVKLTATATSALLFALLLASCSNDNNNNVNLPVSSPIQQDQTVSPDKTNTEETQIDGKTDDVNSNDGQNSAETNQDDSKKPVVQDTNTYEATGKYLGAIDNNSIEVEINGVPTVFILTDAFDYVVSDFAENSKVTLKYTKDSDGNYVQNVVTAISNAK